jgi:hypothetical protein
MEGGDGGTSRLLPKPVRFRAGPETRRGDREKIALWSRKTRRERRKDEGGRMKDED